MSMTEFADLLGYYGESRAPHECTEPATLAELFAPTTASQRWPVRNHEERAPISPMKRAIIHARDGGRCLYCDRHVEPLVLDHIIPRCAFYSWDLPIADRSDNLQSACWDCNETRSNFESRHVKRLGVTPRCFYCVYPEFLEENAPDDVVLPFPVDLLAYCGRCGISKVPNLAWVL